jgi:hypothetical protein
MDIEKEVPKGLETNPNVCNSVMDIFTEKEFITWN